MGEDEDTPQAPQDRGAPEEEESQLPLSQEARTTPPLPRSPAAHGTGVVSWWR